MDLLNSTIIPNERKKKERILLREKEKSFRHFVQKITLFEKSQLTCGFDNDVLQKREWAKGLAWRTPSQRPHGEVVVFSLPYGKLFFIVFEGVKCMCCIKFLVIFSMTSFFFPVMPWRKGPNLFVFDSQLIQRLFKQWLRWILRTGHRISELKAVVGLYTFDWIWKLFDAMFKELCRRVSVMLRKCFQIPKTGIFINKCVLIPSRFLFLPNNANFGNEFYINLNALTGICHLFIWLWLIFFGIWKLGCHHFSFFQKLV